MSQISSSSIQNHILRSLPSEELRRLQGSLEPVTLNVKDVLVQPDVPIAYAYFVERGMASVVTIGEAGRGVEVSCVGREGMAGLPLLFDLDSTPLTTCVQIAGSAFRIAKADLKEAMDASASLRLKLLRYSHATMLQAAEAAHGFGLYTISQRLARWILLAHDRTDGDDILLTHELLALMLGVRRSGVTDAVAILEGEGMIKGLRAQIIVRDRAALIQRAGGCYGRSEAEYARVMAA